MKRILYKSVPFNKDHVTLALESGVDGVITESAHVEEIQALSRTPIFAVDDFVTVAINEKSDEETAVAAANRGEDTILAKGWEIIPVENILAQVEAIGAEAESLDKARLAAGILEHGVTTLVILPEAITDLKTIVGELKLSQGTMELTSATITEVTSVGMGHRVCVDTMSILRKGDGMLTGNSSAFMALVHPETESNPYVASRPFRVNAGAVHAYVQMPGDKTRYLEELASGDEVLIVSADGSTRLATIGRVKVEVRPMLLITAQAGDKVGKIFLQNAETIRVVTPKGEPVSVVDIKPGDEILVRVDDAGRHFGMRIKEEIKEG